MGNADLLRNLSDEIPVGAWLAREECTAVFQVLRVIVLRGQATLPQVLRLNRLALVRMGASRLRSEEEAFKKAGRPTS
ncbi:hypothetical protein TU81_02485 [Pseudomonas lini]|nr:hypothetical protein TU81_02485 [Pseudomonas lini]